MTRPAPKAAGGSLRTWASRVRTSYSTAEIGRAVDYEAIKRNGFRDQGIVIVSVNDAGLSWDQREIIKQVGEKLYGRKAS